VDWYLGLGLRKKVAVGLAAAIGLFLASFFGTLVVLSLSRSGDEGSVPEASGTAPGITYPGGSSAASSLAELDINLKITSARWESEKAVVEGTWEGEISSVHCDLMEGEQQTTDWWDRLVPANMSWQKRIFTQDFVEARGRKIEDPIDAATRYTVTCAGQFSKGWQMNDTAPVEGTPPG